MFSSKIAVLSVFVFCLFTLGQAAPVLDDITSLSAREASDSLVTRNFFTNLFHKGKVDAATKNVTQTAHCSAIHVLLRSQKEYLAAEKELKAEKDKLVAKGSKPKDAAVKEYTKQIKEFASMAKKVASKASDREKSLKKLGFTGGRTQCKSVAAAKSLAAHKSSATSTSTHSAPTSKPSSHSHSEEDD